MTSHQLFSTRRGNGLLLRMPEELHPLAELAYDLWWTWHPGGEELFRAIDGDRWEASGRNPVKLLRDVSPARLEAMRRDEPYRARLRAFHESWRQDLARPPFEHPAVKPSRPIAFICAEYGLDAALPIYSGGLGVLAGDVLKQASDSKIPMVGVGLFYRRGYFRQRLDRSGWQHEYWTSLDPEELPMVPELDDHRPIHVRLRDRSVAIRMWRVQVGSVPLYLLDTNLPENDPTSRWITSTLYVSDRTMRLMQYAVLAIGGVRALRALGVEPSVFHLNEGHASLAALELLRSARADGLGHSAAIESVRSRVVFTTHTPVAAGNEHYSAEEVGSVFGRLAEHVGIDDHELRELSSDASGGLGVTELALRLSRSTNGVSKKHGEVARGMWQHLWPGRDARDVPIRHVTNGVHAPTWMASPMRELLDRHLGADWSTRGGEVLERIDAIDSKELWDARNTLRTSLVHYIRAKTVEDRLARSEPIAYAEGAWSTFDPNVLTIGFARRIAVYKRLHLLIRDPERALGLLRGGRLQVVIAGRAHPQDEQAKHIVKSIFELKDAVGSRVVFLEDYDLAVAHQLVAGCDVWVNVPRAPLEASGTSGMKAALNGALNLSVLDGWWCEAYEENLTGWGIASSNEADESTQDDRDARTLFGLLEREVLPMFYERDAEGIPREWTRRIKASLRRIATMFTTKRMLDEYADRVWQERAGE